MTYDRDLKLCRRALWLMAVANLGMGYWNARNHQWLVATTCFVWAVNCLLFATVAIRSQQRTRDEQRLVVSMMQPLAEDK